MNLKMASLSPAERAFLLGGSLADFARMLGRHMHVRLRQALPREAGLQVIWVDGGDDDLATTDDWLALDAALIGAWGEARWSMALAPGAGGFAARVAEDLRARLSRAYAQAWLDGGGELRSLHYQVQLRGAAGRCRYYPAALGDASALMRWARTMVGMP